MCDLKLYFSFTKLIKELTTPFLIGKYMADNFTYQYQAMGTKSPFQLYKVRLGDCNDFSRFATYIAIKHNYKTYQIRMTREESDIAHWLGVYVEDNKYTYSSNQYYSDIKFNTFREIVDYFNKLKNRIWIGYKIYDNKMNIIEEDKK